MKNWKLISSISIFCKIFPLLHKLGLLASWEFMALVQGSFFIPISISLNDKYLGFISNLSLREVFLDLFCSWSLVNDIPSMPQSPLLLYTDDSVSNLTSLQLRFFTGGFMRFCSKSPSRNLHHWECSYYQQKFHQRLGIDLYDLTCNLHISYIINNAYNSLWSFPSNL